MTSHVPPSDKGEEAGGKQIKVSGVIKQTNAAGFDSQTTFLTSNTFFSHCFSSCPNCMATISD